MSAILKFDFQKKKIITFFKRRLTKIHQKDTILHVPITFSLIQGQTRTSSAPIWVPLTRKCLSYVSLPFVQGGGGNLGTFRRNFGTKLAPYLYTPKTTINQQNEHSKNVTFQNGGQKTSFRFCENSHVTKI